MRYYSLFFFLLTATAIFAQTPCVPNDTVTSIVYPLPSDSTGMGGIDKIACKGNPYSFIWTFNIPTTFTASGLTANLDSVVIATEAAVKNLPANLDYTCNPPNCVFKANQKGCIEINGTVANTAPVGDIELLIAVVIHGKAFGAPLALPFDIPNPSITGPGKYILKVREANDPLCTTGLPEYLDLLPAMVLSPVPASDYVRIDMDARTSGDYEMQIIHRNGQILKQETLSLSVGSNTAEIDLTSVPSGSHYIAISKDGRLTARTLTVVK